MLLGIETSSYIPLIMNTPNTYSLLRLLRGEEVPVRLVIHKDSIRETLSLFDIVRSKWSDDPVYRIRWLAENLDDDELAHFKFPGDAFRLIIGGNIGPPWYSYLNHTRLCGFLYASTIDSLDLGQNPRGILLQLAHEIEEVRTGIVNTMNQHLRSQRFKIEMESRYTCWGPFYMAPDTHRFPEIEVAEDYDQDEFEAPFCTINLKHLRSDRAPGTRDAYHYALMLTLKQIPDIMIVADSGFKQQVKKHLGS